MVRKVNFLLRGLLPLVLLASASLHAATLRVNDFGAKGDGATDDTKAIQRALDKAAGHNDTVTFAPGTYRTGSIFVKSNTHLEIAKGVTLIGIQSLSAYPQMPTRVAGIEMTWPAALVNVYKQQHVQITAKEPSTAMAVTGGKATGICALRMNPRGCAGPAITTRNGLG